MVVEPTTNVALTQTSGLHRNQGGGARAVYGQSQNGNKPPTLAGVKEACVHMYAAGPRNVLHVLPLPEPVVIQHFVPSTLGLLWLL